MDVQSSTETAEFADGNARSRVVIQEGCIGGRVFFTKQRKRIGALLWILCAQFFVAEQLTSRAWRLPYSFYHNYISDLGAVQCGTVICSPWHQAMNGSFVLQGFLIGGGALCFWPRFNRTGKLSSSLLAISAVGVVLVGLAPSDSNSLIHTIGATAHFVAAGLGICVMGLARLRGGGDRFWGWFSVVTGIVVLTAIAMVGSLHPASGKIFERVGAIERAGAYGIVLWLITAGCQGWIATAGGSAVSQTGMFEGTADGNHVKTKQRDRTFAR